MVLSYVRARLHPQRPTMPRFKQANICGIEQGLLKTDPRVIYRALIVFRRAGDASTQSMLEQRLFEHLLSPDADSRCAVYFTRKNDIQSLVYLALNSQNRAVRMLVATSLIRGLVTKSEFKLGDFSHALNNIVTASKDKELRLFIMRGVADINLTFAPHNEEDLKEWLELLHENFNHLITGRNGNMVFDAQFRAKAFEMLLKFYPDKKPRCLEHILRIYLKEERFLGSLILKTLYEYDHITVDDIRKALDNIEGTEVARIAGSLYGELVLPSRYHDTNRLLEIPIIERLKKECEAFVSGDLKMGLVESKFTALYAYINWGENKELLLKIADALETVVTNTTFEHPNIHYPFIILRELALEKADPDGHNESECQEVRAKARNILARHLDYWRLVLPKVVANFENSRINSYIRQRDKIDFIYVHLSLLASDPAEEAQLLALELTRRADVLVGRGLATELAKNSPHSQVRRRALETIENAIGDSDHLRQKVHSLREIVRKGKYEDIFPAAIGMMGGLIRIANRRDYCDDTDIAHLIESAQLAEKPVLLEVVLAELRVFQRRERYSDTVLAVHTHNSIERSAIVRRICEQHITEDLLRVIRTGTQKQMTEFFKLLIQNGKGNDVFRISTWREPHESSKVMVQAAQDAFASMNSIAYAISALKTIAKGDA